MPENKQTRLSNPIRMGAAALVQEAILAGHMKPGDELPQLKLAQKLGLSQASLREALQELEHRGLLVRKGRTRAIINLSEDELAQLFQLRGVLEPLACRLAADCWTEKAGQELEQCLAQMRCAAERNDYREHLRLDLEFHRLIWQSQPNKYLSAHLEMICFQLFAFELIERAEAAYLDFNRTIQQHRFILTLLRSRDGDRVERLIRRLIDRFHRLDLADYRRFRSGLSVSSVRTEGDPK